MIHKSSSWVLLNFVELICSSSGFPSLAALSKWRVIIRRQRAFGAGPPACFPRSVHKVAGQALGFGQPGVRTAASPRHSGSSIKGCGDLMPLQGLGVPGGGGGVPDDAQART